MSSALHDVFGGWPNATQGFIGSMAGVIGAYVVAIRTSRKLSREEEGRRAAGDLIEALVDVSGMLKRLQDAEYQSAHGLSGKQAGDWDRKASRVRSLVAQYGSFLARDLERRGTSLATDMENVLAFTYNPDDSIGLIELRMGGVGVGHDADLLVYDLQGYRRGQSGWWATKVRKARRGERGMKPQDWS